MGTLDWPEVAGPQINLSEARILFDKSVCLFLGVGLGNGCGFVLDFHGDELGRPQLHSVAPLSLDLSPDFFVQVFLRTRLGMEFNRESVHQGGNEIVITSFVQGLEFQ